MNIHLRSGVAIPLIIFMGGAGSAVHAQDGAVNESASVGLEEVVVTARKREESLQQVPASVAALTNSQIQRADLSNIESISTKMPQLVIGRAASGSGAQIVLRGIGSSYTSTGIEQSVATVVDGVYYGQGRVINEAFLDLNRVELIKGPQALFYGKNATAGVLSLATADPTDSSLFIARVGYEFGNHQVVGDFIGSTPITDTLGIRVAVRASDASGGLFTNRAGNAAYTSTDIRTGRVTSFVGTPADRHPGGQQLVGRVTLQWKPTDALTATMKASATRDNQDNPAANFVTFYCPLGRAQNNPTLTCGERFDINYHNLPSQIAQTIPGLGDGQLFSHYRSTSVSGTVNYDTDKMTVTSVTNYQTMRNANVFDAAFAGNPTSALFAPARTRWHAFSSEARVLTHLDSPINFLVGGYYQRTRLGYREYVLVNALSLSEDSLAPPQYRYLTRTKSSSTAGETYSAYGQAIVKPTEDIELTAGVRYTRETKDNLYLQPYVPANQQANFPQGRLIALDQTFKNWSPEFTIRWRPTTAITAYAAYKTGFKAGGFSNNTVQTRTTTAADVSFGNEKAKGVEAGLKTMWLDNSLRLNATVFNYKYNGLQVDYFNSALFVFVTNNVGSARSQGVELEGEWAPEAAPGLVLRASTVYNHARYDRFIGPCFTGQTPAEGCSIVGAGGLLFQDQSGKSLLNAPKWTTTLSSAYDMRLPNDYKLALSAEGRFVSKYFVSTTNNPHSIQSSYFDLGGEITLRTPDDRWELALIGRNLTNNFVLTGAFEIGLTGARTGTATGLPSDLVGLVAAPRTVQARLTYRFPG